MIKTIMQLILLSISLIHPITNIAILDLSSNQLSPSDVVGLSNRLRADMVTLSKFKVLEREQMTNILNEQGFQQTGCTDASCAVEIGQLLNVEGIVVGNIDIIANVTSIVLRLVDIKSGNITKTASYNCPDCSISEVLSKGIPATISILSGTKSNMISETTRNRRFGFFIDGMFSMSFQRTFSSGFKTALSMEHNKTLYSAYFRYHNYSTPDILLKNIYIDNTLAQMEYTNRLIEIVNIGASWHKSIFNPNNFTSIYLGLLAGINTFNDRYSSIGILNNYSGRPFTPPSESYSSDAYFGPTLRVKLGKPPFYIISDHDILIGESISYLPSIGFSIKLY